MLEKLFLNIVSMSFTASYVIVFIMLLRLLFKKAPKVISYAMWSVVAFRLICPISFESIYSLIPHAPQPQNSALLQSSQLSSLVYAGNNSGKAIAAQTMTNSVDPMQVYTWIGSRLWLLGIILMLCYSMLSMLSLKKRLKNAQSKGNYIFEVDKLATPFVLGISKPRIFIPSGLDENEKSYILLHEQTHIRRFDHIVKPIAFFILSIHWFNPLVWIAFLLMSTDMELSCDERVIREMGDTIRKAYSASLLSLAAGKRFWNGSPLAFGEGNVRTRIKNVLNYRKPPFWLLIVAMIVTVFIGFGLISNPKAEADIKPKEINLDNGDNLKGASSNMNSVSYEVNWYKNGKAQGSLIILSDENGKQAEKILWDYMIKSSAWPGNDITALKECYQLRASYSDGSTWDYYAYEWNGKSVMQSGKDGQYSIIDNTLYEKLVQLAKSSPSEEENKDTGTSITPEPTQTDLETCIHNAIFSANAGPHPGSDIATEAHTVLKTVEKGNTTTIYAMALYMEFNYLDDGIEESSGSHMPVAITFTKDTAGAYKLKEYWIPQDGNRYASSIKKKFPADISKNAIDTQKYVLAQTQSCYAQAVAYKPLDVDKVLEKLLEKICSSPAEASNPQDYIKEHPIEYREMIFYGSNTLQYCFGMFEKGGQTGLKGQIMASACRDILGKEGSGISANNGQEWFEKFKKKAEKLEKQYGGEYLRKHKPGSWILLLRRYISYVK